MKALAVVVIVMSLLVMVTCTVPNVDNIHLAACNDQCNVTSKACFDNVNNAGQQCLVMDAGEDTSPAQQDALKSLCIETQTKAGEACVNDLIDCIDKCIKQTEDTLKGS